MELTFLWAAEPIRMVEPLILQSLSYVGQGLGEKLIC